MYGWCNTITLSKDLDKYETLISSEVYFIEWFPATSLKVQYMNFCFIRITRKSLRDDGAITVVTLTKRIRVMVMLAMIIRIIKKVTGIMF